MRTKCWQGRCDPACTQITQEPVQTKSEIKDVLVLLLKLGECFLARFLFISRGQSGERHASSDIHLIGHTPPHKSFLGALDGRRRTFRHFSACFRDFLTAHRGQVLFDLARPIHARLNAVGLGSTGLHDYRSCKRLCLATSTQLEALKGIFAVLLTSFLHSTAAKDAATWPLACQRVVNHDPYGKKSPLAPAFMFQHGF